MAKQFRLVDYGIDYARLTSADQRRQEHMFEYFRRKAIADEKLGYKTVPGGAFGFVGKKCRHALWGVKKEWAMVQASGQYARDALNLCMSGIQASRIDIQATFHVEQGTVSDAIREEYEAACAHVRPKGRPLAVKLIEQRHQAQTLYIGSRASDIYVRVYDKYEESGKEEYKGCVRFEVEIKGRAAKALWKHLYETGAGLAELMNLLGDVLHERGIEVPIYQFHNVPVMEFKREKTTAENTLAWLARGVAPSIKKLTAVYGWYALFAITFEEALDSFQQTRVQSLLARSWGN